MKSLTGKSESFPKCPYCNSVSHTSECETNFRNAMSNNNQKECICNKTPHHQKCPAWVDEGVCRASQSSSVPVEKKYHIPVSKGLVSRGVLDIGEKWYTAELGEIENKSDRQLFVEVSISKGTLEQNTSPSHHEASPKQCDCPTKYCKHYESDFDRFVASPKVEEKYEYLPRAFGKNTKLLVDFFTEGKKGKSVVFATPEGNFLSPKAVESLLLQKEMDERKRVNDILDGMKKKKWDKSERFVNGEDMWGERYAEIDSDKVNGYNQCLEQAKHLINNTQEK